MENKVYIIKYKIKKVSIKINNLIKYIINHIIYNLKYTILVKNYNLKSITDQIIFILYNNFFKIRQLIYCFLIINIFVLEI